MALCIGAGGEALLLAITAFTLSWTHSVERISWEEDWRVTPAGLQIVEARVRGSGAGMEPPEGAGLANGWWTYTPALPLLREVVLGSSGATAAWSLCADDDCMELGAERGAPIVLRSCAQGSEEKD